MALKQANREVRILFFSHLVISSMGFVLGYELHYACRKWCQHFSGLQDNDLFLAGVDPGLAQGSAQHHSYYTIQIDRTAAFQEVPGTNGRGKESYIKESCIVN